MFLKIKLLFINVSVNKHHAHNMNVLKNIKNNKLLKLKIIKIFFSIFFCFFVDLYFNHQENTKRERWLNIYNKKIYIFLFFKIIVLSLFIKL